MPLHISPGGVSHVSVAEGSFQVEVRSGSIWQPFDIFSMLCVFILALEDLRHVPGVYLHGYDSV